MAESKTKFMSKTRPISSIYKSISKKNIDIYPPWQRNVVWNTRMQRELVITILKGFPINPIVLWQTDDETKEVCVDGKNRLSAICEFMKNRFTIPYQGKETKYEDLPEKVKDDFDDENLDIRILTGSYWNETKVREYFQVIQGGSKLTWPEIINSFNNSFVDFMRGVMIENQQYFCRVLGDDCNARFELYNIIANVFSVHPIIYGQYKAQKNNNKRTADTNKSLMKYVLNFENFSVTDKQKTYLTTFLRNTIDVIHALSTMQEEEFASQNKSIWFLTENESIPTRIKPGIRDFASVAYYISMNQSLKLPRIIADLKAVFTVFIKSTNNNYEGQDIVELRRHYYITYGKNQKQYAWASVSSRYDIMKKVLEHEYSPLIDL